MSITYGTKINLLLAKTISSGLIFAEWLKYEDHSGQLQKKYRNSGWLTALLVTQVVSPPTAP